MEQSKFNEIQKNFQRIFEFVTTTYDESAEILLGRLTLLSVYQAETSKMLATVEYFAKEDEKDLYMVKCVRGLLDCIESCADTCRCQLNYLTSVNYISCADKRLREVSKANG